MTRDEILNMARPSDPFGPDGRLHDMAELAPGTLLRFAALVEARALAAAPQAEPVIAFSASGEVTTTRTLPAKLLPHIRHIADSLRGYPAPAADVIPDVLFDGFRVLNALSPIAAARTKHTNVSDVLDAVVRLLRSESCSAAMKGADR